MKKSWSLFALLLALVIMPGLFANGQKDNSQPGASVDTNAVRSGQYGEAPSVAELVKTGALPAVTERLPLNPRREQVEEIGNTAAYISPLEWALPRGSSTRKV